MKHGIDWKMALVYAGVSFGLLLLTGSFLMTLGILLLLFVLEYVVELIARKFKK